MSKVTRQVVIGSAIMASASILWLTWAVVINPRPLLGLALIALAVTVASVFRVTGQKAWCWLYRVGIVAVAVLSMWKYPISTSLWTAAVAGSMATLMTRREVVRDLRMLWGV